MSEENWKKLSEMFDKKLEMFKKDWETLVKSQSGSSKEEIHVETAHKTLEEILECPTCKPKLKDKLKEEILKAERDKRKAFKNPELCEDCGEIFDGEEKEDCPTCGKHKSGW